MVGIDISDRSIKLVRLDDGARRTVLSHCWKEVPSGLIENGVVTDVAQVSQLVQSAYEECSLSIKSREAAVVSIPETQSFLRVIELPAMSQEEVSEAIKWEVGQHLPLGIDNLYIDWQRVNNGHAPAAGRWEVLVGAAQRKVVDPLYEALTALRIDVAALELESQAIVRSLLSEDLRQRKGLLIVDLGDSATNIVIHDHGTIRFTATLTEGGVTLFSELSAEELDQISGSPQSRIKEAPEWAYKLQPGLEKLVTEVRSLVEFYNGMDSTHQVHEILLTGGGSNLPGLSEVFARYFDNVHVQRGNPWITLLDETREAKLPMSIEESVHFTTAVGLALRPVLI